MRKIVKRVYVNKAKRTRNPKNNHRQKRWYWLRDAVESLPDVVSVLGVNRREKSAVQPLRFDESVIRFSKGNGKEHSESSTGGGSATATSSTSRTTELPEGKTTSKYETPTSVTTTTSRISIDTLSSSEPEAGPTPKPSNAFVELNESISRIFESSGIKDAGWEIVSVKDVPKKVTLKDLSSNEKKHLIDKLKKFKERRQLAAAKARTNTPEYEQQPKVIESPISNNFNIRPMVQAILNMFSGVQNTPMARTSENYELGSDLPMAELGRSSIPEDGFVVIISPLNKLSSFSSQGGLDNLIGSGKPTYLASPINRNTNNRRGSLSASSRPSPTQRLPSVSSLPPSRFGSSRPQRPNLATFINNVQYPAGSSMDSVPSVSASSSQKFNANSQTRPSVSNSPSPTSESSKPSNPIANTVLSAQLSSPESASELSSQFSPTVDRRPGVTRIKVPNQRPFSGFTGLTDEEKLETLSNALKATSSSSSSKNNLNRNNMASTDLADRIKDATDKRQNTEQNLSSTNSSNTGGNCLNV